MARGGDAIERFSELDEEVKDLLEKLGPEQVETIKYVSTIPKPELQRLMKMFRDVAAISKFMRWLILGSVALFLGSITLWKSILEFLALMKGGRP